MNVLKQDLIKINERNNEMICQGEWNLTNIISLKKELKKLTWTKDKLNIDGQAIKKMDVAGVWIFYRWIKKLKDHHIQIKFQNFSSESLKLLTIIEKVTQQNLKIPKPKSIFWLARFGKASLEYMKGCVCFLSFVGVLTYEAMRVSFQPVHLRWRALFTVIYRAGYEALPIIALLSCMVGVVIAYQMGLQLRKFGAHIFVVDLLGLAILREFGPLLTAIMVAGRSGSSFTAQLGIMKINQEIDALNTMGVTPTELLILPRIAALFIVLPLLTIWADFFGVYGGMLMTKNMFDIGWHDFLLRFRQEIPLKALLIGLGKAPVFALIIATTGCFQGMQVKGSAESVGQLTTRSVVFSIFFIIVADAVFSVIFSKFNL